MADKSREKNEQGNEAQRIAMLGPVTDEVLACMYAGTRYEMSNLDGTPSPAVSVYELILGQLSKNKWIDRSALMGYVNDAINRIGYLLARSSWPELTEVEKKQGTTEMAATLIGLKHLIETCPALLYHFARTVSTKEEHFWGSDPWQWFVSTVLLDIDPNEHARSQRDSSSIEATVSELLAHGI